MILCKIFYDDLGQLRYNFDEGMNYVLFIHEPWRIAQITLYRKNWNQELFGVLFSLFHFDGIRNVSSTWHSKHSTKFYFKSILLIGLIKLSIANGWRYKKPELNRSLPNFHQPEQHTNTHWYLIFKFSSSAKLQNLMSANKRLQSKQATNPTTTKAANKKWQQNRSSTLIKANWNLYTACESKFIILSNILLLALMKWFYLSANVFYDFSPNGMPVCQFEIVNLKSRIESSINICFNILSSDVTLI